MAGIEVASHVLARDCAQPEHRLRTVDHEAGMHFDRNLYSMISGKLRMLDPVGCNYLVPLPIKDRAEVWRPRARDPVGRDSVGRIPGATGEVHHDGNAEFLGQQDGLAARLPMRLPEGLVRVQRIAVTA